MTTPRIIRDRIVGRAGMMAILLLSLGFGIGAAVLSVARVLLFEAVPGVSTGEKFAVVMFGERRPGGAIRVNRVSYAQYAEFAPFLKHFSHLAGFQRSELTLSLDDALPVRQQGLFTMSGYLETLGVAIARGRDLRPSDDKFGAPLVCVVSDRLSRIVFPDGRPAPGRTLEINGVIVTVVGVTEPGFRGHERLAPTDVWLPGASYYQLLHQRTPEDGHAGFYEFVGRLSEGSRPQEASAELATLAASDTRGAVPQATLYPGLGLPPMSRDAVRESVRRLGVLAFLLVFLSCFSVAGLYLVDAARQQHDLGIRRALGAGGWALARDQLAHVAAVGLGSGVLALWVAHLVAEGLTLSLSPILVGIQAPDIPVVDVRLGSLMIAASAVCAFVSRAIPIVAAFRTAPSSWLRAGRGVRVERIRALTVVSVVQGAVAFALLVGASVMVATLARLTNVDIGFDAERLFVFEADPGDVGYAAEASHHYFNVLRDRIQAEPEIVAVGISSMVPFRGGSFETRVYRAGADPHLDAVTVSSTAVSAGYFEALGVRIRSTDVRRPLFHEANSHAGVVLNETLARKLFNSEHPVGRFVGFAGRHERIYRVDGVVADHHSEDLTRAVGPAIFETLGRTRSLRRAAVLVRMQRTEESIVARVEDAAAEVNSRVPLTRVGWLADSVERESVERRGLVALLSAIGILAAILAAASVHAVAAQILQARRHEIAIRIALGAPPLRVASPALARMVIVLAGALGLGSIAARWMVTVLESQLLGARLDAVAFMQAGVVVTLSIAAATLPSVVGAMRIDPAAALRES